MWLLHPGPDLLRCRSHSRRQSKNCRRHPGIDEWQSVPLRCLSVHSRRHSTSRAERQKESQMNRFSYARVVAVEDALTEFTPNNGTQFIAGGTNLIDLMKENVARPSRLIDVSRLPLK